MFWVGGGDYAYSECLFYKTPYRGKDSKKAKALGMILVKEFLREKNVF